MYAEAVQAEYGSVRRSALKTGERTAVRVAVTDDICGEPAAYH